MEIVNVDYWTNGEFEPKKPQGQKWWYNNDNKVIVTFDHNFFLQEATIKVSELKQFLIDTNGLEFREDDFHPTNGHVQREWKVPFESYMADCIHMIEEEKVYKNYLLSYKTIAHEQEKQ
jgi:hypothetical protein